MIDKNKMEEIEYYTYIESILDNIDKNIDKIEILEESTKKTKLNIKIIYGLLIVSFIINIVLIYLVVAK